MENDFKVKVGEYEGPLLLILDLIEKRKLHVSEVALAQVTDDYVEYLKRFDPPAGGETSLGSMADFILVAATLMLIKSVALLPSLQLSEEEKASVEELERRLKIYQIIRDAVPKLKEAWGVQPVFFKQEAKNVGPVFTVTPEISLSNLAQAIKNLLQALPVPEKLAQVMVKKVISLEKVITDLAARAERALNLSFREFVKDKKEKVNVIVSFLGMLELVRRGLIEVRQEAHFHDIKMEAINLGVPRYN